MKKRKIFASTIVATLTGLSLLAITANAVSNNTTSETRNSLNSIQYSRVEYKTIENVTISGPTISKARVGARFSSVPKPTAFHKDNYRFLGWSTVKGDEKSILVDTAKVPSTGWVLYPVFETPAKLSNCLCVSAIEDSTVTINFQKTPTPLSTNDEERKTVDMAYSTDFGATWKPVEYNPDQEKYTWTSDTIPANGCLYLKGNNPKGLSTAADNYTHITFTGKVNLFGNAMGLINNGSLESQKYKTIPCDYCFYHLFENETNIQYVADNFFPCEGNPADTEEVQAETLKAHCYEGAFKGCSSMVHAPRLFATKAAVLGDTNHDTTNCFKEIFYGCTSIDYIRIRYDGTIDECKTGEYSQFNNWVNGVSTLVQGTFTYNGESSAADFGFENNWTAKLTPTSGENEDVQIVNSPDECIVDKEYQFNVEVKCSGTEIERDVEQGVYWTSDDETIASIDHKSGKLTGHPYNYNPTEGPKKVKINAFSKANLNAQATKIVTIKPIMLDSCTSVKAVTDTRFSVTYTGTAPSTGVPKFKYSVDAGKNWQDMVFNEDIHIKAGDTIYLKGYNIKGLCNGTLDSHTQFLTNEGEIELGGDIRSLIYGGEEGTEIPCEYCFNNLFSGTNVTKVNSGFLPFTTLTKGCYEYMFMDCKKLTDLPSDLLPAGKDGTGALADECYARMFYGCDHLVDKLPELPATELKTECYRAMFYECYSLEKTVALPAETAAEGCYYFMFQSCNNLKSIEKISLTSLAAYACCQTFALETWNNIEIDTTGDADKLILTTPNYVSTSNYSTRLMFGESYWLNLSANTSYYWKAKA